VRVRRSTTQQIPRRSRCPTNPRLDALEADHAFLLRGDVFTKDVIETWLGYKRDKEIPAAPASLRVPSLL